MWDRILDVAKLLMPAVTNIGAPLAGQALAGAFGKKPKSPAASAPTGAGPGPGAPGQAGPDQTLGGPVSGTPMPRQTSLNFSGGFTGGAPMGPSSGDSKQPPQFSQGFRIPTPGTRDPRQAMQLPTGNI